MFRNLTGSFSEVEWRDVDPGVCEKRLGVGSKLIRLLELTDKLDHPQWCLTGHTGYVLDGEFTLDLNGTDHTLSKGDVFDVIENKNSHRHIPKLSPGGRVILLLVES